MLHWPTCQSAQNSPFNFFFYLNNWNFFFFHLSFHLIFFFKKKTRKDLNSIMIINEYRVINNCTEGEYQVGKILIKKKSTFFFCITCFFWRFFFYSTIICYRSSIQATNWWWWRCWSSKEWTLWKAQRKGSIYSKDLSIIFSCSCLGSCCCSCWSSWSLWRGKPFVYVFFFFIKKAWY